VASQAEKFVAKLKRSHRRKVTLLSMLQVSWRVHRSLFAGLKAYFSEDPRHRYIYGLIVQGLPEDVRSFVSSGQVILAGVHDPVPEAYVKFFDDESCAIVYNFGLMDFMYRVCQAFAAHFVRPGDYGPSDRAFTGVLSLPQGPVESDGLRVIAEIFWWYQQTGKSFGPAYPGWDGQVKVAGFLAFAAEAFFLAHEFGHIAFRIRAGKSMSTEVEELEADGFALEIVAEAIRMGGFARPPDIVWIGIYVGLLIFTALEALGSDFGSTHPAFSDRLELFRAFAARELKNAELEQHVFEIGEIVEGVFSEIVRIALRPTVLERKFYREHERQAAKAFCDLVDQSANYPRGNPRLLTADHEFFALGMNSLMRSGHAYVLLEEAKRMASENVELLAAINESEDADEALTMKWALAFNRVRVLGLWAADAIEPIGSLFHNAMLEASKATRSASRV
jgi:hypothetical protein